MVVRITDNLLRIVLTFVSVTSIIDDRVLLKYAPAELAKLVDALDSDSSGSFPLRVQVSRSASKCLSFGF